jgi:serine/threonine-protein kinase
MTDWQKIEEGIAGVSGISIAAREAWLDNFFAGDEELKYEAPSLLAFEPEAESFLEKSIKPYAAMILADHPTDLVEKQFGHYRIIREIGRGGMGAVFLARRDDGEFDQEVALKIVRQSIAEEYLIDRFRRERQILASLNHPNVARLLDGGVSDNGEPFIVMEFIDGQPITEFAANTALSLNDKLSVFIKVCSALSYAHKNLIVHRDIKPGNIMVTSGGEPKLLDFGLAKLVDESLKSDVEQTQTAFRALTPAYASPEQIRGQPLTTASDIYSLGVVLYELLTGERPFRFEDKDLDEILLLSNTREPPAPSVVAKGTPLERRSLRGDLDNIVLTALRREPERRYDSVEAFAADIQRHLNGLPVSARPNTLRYRATKYVLRHRVGAIAASLVFISLVGGIVGSLWQARVAQHEKQRAENVSAFLEDALKYSNPFMGKIKKAGNEVTVNDVLDEASKRIKNGEFDNDPELKLELERMIASTYFSQGKYLAAREHLVEFVRLTRELYGPNNLKSITATCYWAALLFAKGEMNEAEAGYRESVPRLRDEFSRGNVKPEIFADILNNFAYLRRTQGDSHEAELLFREALKIFPEISPDNRKLLEATKSTLASTIADQGRFDEALMTALDAVNYYRSDGQTENPNYGFALTIYGGFLTEKGEFETAAKSLEEGNAVLHRFLAPSNLWIGDNVRNQAVLLYNEGKFAEAVEMANRAAAMYEENFGKHYDHYPTVLIAKGLSLAKLGREKEGEILLREAVAIRTSSLPEGHFWVAAANGALGECLMIEKRYSEAEPLLRASFESLQLSQERTSPRLGLAKKRLVMLYQEMKRSELIDQMAN